MLYQVLYSSAAAIEFDEEMLLELLEGARLSNQELGVTGMLLYAEGSFLQVLEGEREVVDSLFAKIEEDSRHLEARVLLRSDIEERMFGDWSMGFHFAQKLSELPEGLNLFLQQGEKVAEEANAALKTLCAFRDGRWRRAV